MGSRKIPCKILCFIGILFYTGLSLSGATRYSVASGNWSSTATWSATSGGAPGASVPVAVDIVYIENGNSITVTANAACTSITFPNPGGTNPNPTLTVNATFTLTVSGAVTIREFEGELDGVVTIAGGGTLVCTDVTLGQFPYDPGAKLTATQSIISTIASFIISGNLNLISPYKNPNRFRNAVFNIASGIVTIGGSVTSTNENTGNISTLTMATGAQTGTLILSGTTPFSLSATGTNTMTLNGTSALVNYNRVGAQTVYPTTYNNLTLSVSGAKTLPVATVNGIISMEGTATTAGSTPTYGAASTLQYKGSASQTTGIEFPATFSGTGGVIINNINGVLLSGSYTINSILTLTSGAFSLGANTLTLANGSNLSYGGGSLTGGATSNLTIGTGANITLNVISGGLNNFNTSRNIILGADLSVNGTLTLTAGTFSVSAYTLTFQNSNTPIVRTSGTITTTSSSNLSFGSSGNTGGNAFTLPAGTFTTAPIINNLSIYRTNSLTLNEQMMSLNGILLCNGPLNTNQNLILLSTAGGTALIDGSGTGQVTGNVTMQRYLPSGFGYKYFSSPFQAATVNEFGDDMTLGSPFTPFYRYDENRIISGLPASGWVSYKTTTNVLNPLAGYAVNFGSVAAPNTVDITGIVNNGSMSVTLYNNDQIYTKGFNLIGNPYPSSIDWNAATGWTKDFIDNALYYYKASTIDQYGGTYRTYVNWISSDGIVNNIIPSMQGFFVHVANGAYPVTGTLAMDNSVRINDLTHSFTKKSAGKGANSLLRLIAGYSDDNASFDPLVIYYDYKATSGFDSQLDALKLFNTDSKVTNFYSFGNDGARLSIDALPETEDDLITIPLGLKTAKNGDIIFRIRDIEGAFSGKTIYIFDVVTATNNILLPDNEYRVLLNAGDYNNRFFLNFSNITTDMPDFTSGVDLLTIYASYGILKAEINIPQGENGILTIYNLLGQVILKSNINEPGHYEFSPEIKDGIYLVNFVSATRRVTRKIFIQSK